jgi:glutamate--cysteine ligase
VGWKFVEITPDELGGAERRIFQVTMDQGDLLTFEPGGQLEFSSTPYPCLADGILRLNRVQEILDEGFGRYRACLTQAGINPWLEPDDIGLQMPKKRYRAMDAYFTKIGPYGRRMMRQTCTIQVNLDFGPTSDVLAKRFLAAQALSPIGLASFAHSPVLKGQPQKEKSFRSVTWQHIDPSRTGFPKLSEIQKNPSQKACIESYWEFALNAHVIFVEALDYKVPEKPLKFRDWILHGYEGVKPTIADFKTHMSLLFPEVRPRGFLELRPIDCNPRAQQTVPFALMTGILYDDKSLDRFLDLMMPHIGNLPGLWRKASFGYEDNLVYDLVKKTYALSAEGFSRLPNCFKGANVCEQFQKYQEKYILRRRVPADDMLDAVVQKIGSMGVDKAIFDYLKSNNHS